MYNYDRYTNIHSCLGYRIVAILVLSSAWKAVMRLRSNKLKTIGLQGDGATDDG